jgi:hypothetical protein
MIHRPKYISYLKVGYLLHLMSILEITIYWVAYYSLDMNEWLMSEKTGWKLMLLFPFAIAPFFPQFDAYSRFQNYKLVKDLLYEHGFQARIIKPFIQSRCQRDAVMVAAEELGFKNECKLHFANYGYKWYHLLPDFLFTHPSVLLQKAFWLNTFFAKTYAAKYDFRKTNIKVYKASNKISLAETV